MHCDIAVQEVVLRDSPKANHAEAYCAFDTLLCYSYGVNHKLLAKRHATYIKAQNVAAENQAMACDAVLEPHLLADATMWQNP